MSAIKFWNRPWKLSCGVRSLLRTCLVVLFTLVCAATAACGDDKPSAIDGGNRLPKDYAGAINIGPQGLPFASSAKSEVVVFDSRGDRVGQYSGPAISGSASSLWADGLSYVTADAIRSVDSKGLHETPIDENMLLGMSTRPQDYSEQAYWFNSAYSNSSNGYRSKYVIMKGSRRINSGYVPGYVYSIGFCGKNYWALSKQVGTASSGETENQELFIIGDDKENARRVGSWSTSVDVRPTSNMFCLDGKYLVAGYEDISFGRKPMVVVVGIGNPSSRVMHRLSVPNSKAGDMIPGSIMMNQGRIYWISTDRIVRSVSAYNFEDARMWSIPREIGELISIYSRGAEMSVLTHSNTRARYDLRTWNISSGKIVRDIEMTWIDNLLQQGGADVGVVGLAMR